MSDCIVTYASGSDLPEGWYAYKNGFLIGPFDDEVAAKLNGDRIVE